MYMNLESSVALKSKLAFTFIKIRIIYYDICCSLPYPTADYEIMDVGVGFMLHLKTASNKFFTPFIAICNDSKGSRHVNLLLNTVFTNWLQSISYGTFDCLFAEGREHVFCASVNTDRGYL